MPIWAYGWFSTFSGTPIYPQALYVGYNILFTFFPIIWFATNDWAFEKSFMLSRPKLYWIGMNDVYFNPYVFWRWFFLAMIKSSLIMVVCTYTVDGISESGKTGVQ